MTEYKICKTCVMDTSDSSISFNSDGECVYCTNFTQNIKPNWDFSKSGQAELELISDKIKSHGKSKQFDCIIGISGGLDSSYAAYVAKVKMGLRPLLFHVDAGWNTAQAVNNIEKLVDGLGLDLYTEVINWQEMRDLQVSFFKSQIPDQDIPQDTAFFSALYKFARKNHVKYIITGGNYSTECCREPEQWGAYPGIDKTLIMDIHNKFSNSKIIDFPIVDVLTYKIWYQKILGMKVVQPLNYIPFIKSEAERELNELFGWQKFQHKHHESRFTRFYEDYWLPRKFGYQKRRAHFSSLIMTGQLERNEALERLSRPELSEKFHMMEFEYVANKLGLSIDELQNIFKCDNKTYLNYRNKRWAIGFGAYIMQKLGLERRLFK